MADPPMLDPCEFEGGPIPLSRPSSLCHAMTAEERKESMNSLSTSSSSTQIDTPDRWQTQLLISLAILKSHNVVSVECFNHLRQRITASDGKHPEWLRLAAWAQYVVTLGNKLTTLPVKLTPDSEPHVMELKKIRGFVDPQLRVLLSKIPEPQIPVSVPTAHFDAVSWHRPMRPVHSHILPNNVNKTLKPTPLWYARGGSGFNRVVFQPNGYKNLAYRHATPSVHVSEIRQPPAKQAAHGTLYLWVCPNGHLGAGATACDYLLYHYAPPGTTSWDGRIHVWPVGTSPATHFFPISVHYLRFDFHEPTHVNPL